MADGGGGGEGFTSDGGLFPPSPPGGGAEMEGGEEGEDGYFPSDLPNSGKEENRRVVDERNREGGVSKAQEAAMSAGSMFGWDVPAADPRSYDENGVLLKSDRPDRGDAR